jgi:hypothetical protein
MPIPYTNYVDVNVTLAPSGAPQAQFGNSVFFNENTVDLTPLQGPFSSPQDVLDFGFAAGSPMHNYAVGVAQQNPRNDVFYSGRVTGGDFAAGYLAAVASNPGAFYGVTMESRDTAQILAVAPLVEAARKIALFQSNEASMLDGSLGLAFGAQFQGTPVDGTYRTTFTGYGLVSPVDVDVVRAGGTPATNTDLGTALAAALIAAAGAGLAGVINLASIVDDLAGTVTFATEDGLIGTVTVTDPEAPDGLVVTVLDGDVASQMLALQLSRSSLWYHATDTELLAERVMARCFGNDLDQQQLSWSYKPLGGVPGATLTGAQAAVLRAANANYFANAISTAGNVSSPFTAPGTMSVGASGAGRLIRVQTSLDWFHARSEEALLSVFLREPNAVFLDDNGINKFAAAQRGVFTTGVAADHFIEKIVPDGEDFAGIRTPAVFAPKASSISVEDREAGILRLTALGYLKASAERVVANIEVRQ